MQKFPSELEVTYKIVVTETDTNLVDVVYKDLEPEIAEMRFAQAIKECNFNRTIGDCGECKIQMIDSYGCVMEEEIV